MKRRLIAAAFIGVLSFCCVACSNGTESSAGSAVQEVSESDSAAQGEAFIRAMKPYLNYLGEETVNGSLSMPEELIENSASITFCDVEGTVSHGFGDVGATRATICDWVSNKAVDKSIYNETIAALRSYYGWDGISGTSDATAEFDAFEYVSWDDTETNGRVSIFLDGNVLHVRWWLDDNTELSTNGDTPATDEEDDREEHDYSSSRSLSNRTDSPGSSNDSDYDYLYDEDTGIYGVYDSEDGDGLFAGDDFAMHMNEDGTSIATDGKGNWVADTDGDGEADSISIDGGETWY